MRSYASECSRGGHENVAKTKMSKMAEVELNPPADAEGDESQQSGSPAKPDPKQEATKKAVTAMYDSMVPLSGQKSRDDDDASDDGRKRRRGRGQNQRRTPAAEESPEATTDCFKKTCISFMFDSFCMLFQTSVATS